MKIEKNKVVSLIYELRETNSAGRIIEALEEAKPMTFLYGSGRLLPHFESELISLEKGDNFSFILNSGEAYGEKMENMVIDVPPSVFETDGKVDENICKVGNVIPMKGSNGNRLDGVINEITDTYVKMDFNHPLAGIDLCFTGKIIDIRDATQEEIASTGYSCSSCSSFNKESGCAGPCN
jgi:FKBP-type peptidyl-prolyl cis-trans isomerase SlyD